MVDKNKEGLKNILQAINNIIEPKVNNLKYDKTYRGKIVRVIDNGVYIVKVKDTEYRVNYGDTLSVGDIVNVKAPLNNFSDIYIETLPGSGGGSGGGTTNYNNLTNKPQLNTISAAALSTDAAEIIRGTIYLHKIAKTGNYNDLINLPALNYVPTSDKGARNGVATLDLNGRLPSSQMPMGLIDDDNYVHTDNNFTTDLKNKLDGIEGGAQVNKIEKIQKNGVELLIQNKTVNITVPVNTSDLTNNSGFITNSVNNLTNYYLKTDLYTKEEVNTLVGQMSTVTFNVVDELPISGRGNIIYLVPISGAQNDTYHEYIYINNSWELIGATNVDLSDYITHEELSQALADYATITTLNSGLNTKVDKVQGKGLSTEDYTTTEKNKLAGIEDNAEVNIINAIQKNGEDLIVSNKTVNITVPTKTSDLTNDTGYISTETDPVFNNSIAATITQEDIDNWNDKQSGIVFNSPYNPVSNKAATMDDITASEVSDVLVNGESVVFDTVAEVLVPTKTSDLTNDSGFISGLSIIDNLNSTSSTDGLSANQGRVLNEQKALRSIYNDTNISLGRQSGQIIGVDSIAYGYQTNASGDYSVGIGYNARATGEASQAFGHITQSTGDYAHAEGDGCSSSGIGSHTEGHSCTASGDYAHAEGKNTQAIGLNSHAAGNNSIALGKDSTAIGSFEEDYFGDGNYLIGEITELSSDRKTITFHIDEDENWYYYEYYPTFQFNCVGCTYWYYDETLDEGAYDINNYVNHQMKQYVDPDYVEQKGYLTIVFEKPVHSYLQVNEEIVLRNIKNVSSGISSFAGGLRTRATGDSSVAFGINCTAIGEASHVEGFHSVAGGDYSHAEGVRAEAHGSSSHAEGWSTTYGNRAHAENESMATGFCSHSEGYDTQAFGDNSHAGGNETFAYGENSFTGGSSLEYNYRDRDILLQGEIQSISQDKKTVTFNAINVDINDLAKLQCLGGFYSDVYSIDTTCPVINVTYDTSQYVSGQPFPVTVDFLTEVYYLEVGDTIKIYQYTNIAFGVNSVAGGLACRAIGDNSLALGDKCTALGKSSQAFGSNCQATENWAYAEGEGNVSSSYASHAEGEGTVASSDSAHAENWATIASGFSSHAEGYNSIASNNYAHVEGDATIAASEAQHVQGKYNIEDANGVYAHILGNGTYIGRSNAHTVDWQGNAWYSGDVYTGSTSGTNKDAGSKKLATEDYVNTQLALRTLNSYSQNLSTSLGASSWQTVNPTDYTINLPQGTYRFLISVSFNNASSGLATLRPFINGSEIATSIRTTFPLQSGLDLSAQVEGYTALNGNTSFNAQIYSNVTMTATSITIYVERIN